MTVAYDAALLALNAITDPTELLALSRIAQTHAVQRAKSSLRTLQWVEFDAPRGTQRGQIVAIGPKNVKVQVGNMKWTVFPALLRPSTDPNAKIVPPIVLKTPLIPEVGRGSRYESRF
jgi:flavin-binding protein dodecin